MAFTLDSFSFPFHEPVAMELLTRFTQLHPTSKAASLAAGATGLNTGVLFLDQAPIFAWKEILEEASKQGLLRALVQGERDRLNTNSPFRRFFDDLLNNYSPPLTDEPRDVDGAPRFLSKDDEVMVPEALLYYDDLTLPIGKIPNLIIVLQRLIALAPAVCRLEVNFNGQSGYGTGFRVGSDMLLTNWHVVYHPHTGVRGTSVIAEFGYEDDGQDGALTATPISCDVTSIVTSREDDWAIIRTTQPLLDAWPILKLSEAVEPHVGTSAHIIQHPGGGRKRMGFVRNQVSFYDDRVTHYLTDTQVGSSGSPVFDHECRLIALHHAGGRPQEVLGKPPLSKNEGIRISKVIQGLAAVGVMPL